MKKTDKEVEKKEEVKNPKLEAAIGGLGELMDGMTSAVSQLLGNVHKKAALQRAQDYIGGNYDRWTEVRDGLKVHIGYADMKAIERDRITNNLRYLRQIVGVVARKTKKRNPAKSPKSETVDLQDLINKNDKVILPVFGKTQNERAKLINQVLTALDNALGCTRADTIELILTVTRSNGAKKAA